MWLVFDTEATDLVPGQICQLSYLMVTKDGVTGKNLFFSVDDMSEGALEVHGLTMERLAELSDDQYFEDRVDEFEGDFASAALLVGHNVKADVDYLTVELARCGKKLRKINSFCTMNFASGILGLERRVQTGRPKPPKLSELCEHYEVTEDEIKEGCERWFQGGEQLHDARFDTVATYLCLLRAIEKGDLRMNMPA